MFDTLLQLSLAASITIYFIKKEKPNLFYLFAGYALFLVALTLRLPLEYLRNFLEFHFNSFIFPQIITITLTAILTEVAKYFSLKRFLVTKKIRNAALFGIGWSTIESIVYLKLIYLDTLASFLPFTINTATIAGTSAPLLSFIVFFLMSITTTVLIIISVLRKKMNYTFWAIIMNMAITMMYTFSSDIDHKFVTLGIQIITSLFIMKNYRRFR